MKLFIELLFLTDSMWPRPGADALVAGAIQRLCERDGDRKGGDDHVADGLGRGPGTGAAISAALCPVVRQVGVPNQSLPYFSVHLAFLLARTASLQPRSYNRLSSD